MRRAGLLIALPAALLFAGAASAAQPVSFSRDLVPVFRTSCAACHLTGQEGGKMKLFPAAAYASLVNVAATTSGLLRVKPGAPEQSYLLKKLDGTHLDAGGQGVQMPFGAAPLDPEILRKIREWIAAGAPNN